MWNRKKIQKRLTTEPRFGFLPRMNADYCDLSRKNFRPTVVETVTEIWPALVTADCATGDQEFEERSEVDCKVNPV